MQPMSYPILSKDEAGEDVSHDSQNTHSRQAVTLKSFHYDVGTTITITITITIRTIKTTTIRTTPIIIFMKQLIRKLGS